MRIVLLLAVISAGCSSDDGVDGGDDGDGSGRVAFDDTGEPSKTAEELMAKHDATTSSGIAGVYELTDEASGANENYESFTLRVTRRIELRENKFVVLQRCDIEFEDRAKPDQTLEAFVRLDAEASDDGYEILESASVDRYDASSMAACDLELPRAAWAFCDRIPGSEGSGSDDPGSDDNLAIPDNATTCIGLSDRLLVLLTREDPSNDELEEIGAKVAD